MRFVTEWENNKFEDLEMAIEQAVAHCDVIWKVGSAWYDSALNAICGTKHGSYR